jgi:hypothetical protein
VPSPRILAIMGSGETAPSMVSTHQRVAETVAAHAPDGSITVAVVDTPYGFQENAAEISARTVGYLRRRLDAAVEVVELRDRRRLSPGSYEAALLALERADVIFAGPGSPTFLLDQWRDSPVPDQHANRLT